MEQIKGEACFLCKLLALARQRAFRRSAVLLSFRSFVFLCLDHVSSSNKQKRQSVVSMKFFTELTSFLEGALLFVEEELTTSHFGQEPIIKLCSSFSPRSVATRRSTNNVPIVC